WAPAHLGGAPAAESALDGVAGPEESVRLELGAKRDGDVQEPFLRNRSDRLGAIVGRPGNNAGCLETGEAADCLVDQRFPAAEVAAESQERLNQGGGARSLPRCPRNARSPERTACAP